MRIINLNIVRHTRNFAAMRRFYEHDLGLTVIEEWDDGPANRGAICAITGGGTLEVLTLDDVAQPDLKPHNLQVVIQVDDVQVWHDHLAGKGVPITRGIEEQEWGHRSFGVDDPEGLRVWFVQDLNQNSQST
jgi:uncharacterized glyoxalase superfamily protein PhnB